MIAMGMYDLVGLESPANINNNKLKTFVKINLRTLKTLHFAGAVLGLYKNTHSKAPRNFSSIGQLETSSERVSLSLFSSGCVPLLRWYTEMLYNLGITAFN